MACVRRAYRLISLSLSVGFLRFDGAAVVVDGAVVVAVVASRLALFVRGAMAAIVFRSVC